MSRITFTSRVGSDGVLSLNVPLGPTEANQVVRVTVEVAPPPPITDQAAWQKFVADLAGKITDPSFERHPEGEYEHRDELP